MSLDHPNVVKLYWTLQVTDSNYLKLNLIGWKLSILHLWVRIKRNFVQTYEELWDTAATNWSGDILHSRNNTHIGVLTW